MNQTAGFSIVSYTGTGSSGTVGHGLAKTPKFVIIKNRDSTTNWRVYTTEVDGSMDYLYLNLTNGKQNSGATPFTSSVFELGTNSDQNANTNDIVAYCWAEIEGYSKFGSYIGNGSTDGPFVYCGFKPAWVMIKISGVTNGWVIMDNARSSNNPNGETLFASTSAMNIQVFLSEKWIFFQMDLKLEILELKEILMEGLTSSWHLLNHHSRQRMLNN